MPIYEYRCQSCNRKNSVLSRSFGAPTDLACSFCGGVELRRIYSPVAYHRSESDRISELDTSRPQGEDYYKDSRNVGLWAKKRLKEMGQDLGPQFDEIVENARSGKLTGVDD
ncbi:MAG: zinc ribbon domain-containing protein [Chloroflexota bacterium]|nr:MAG: zinc ribbon domain-containing protein [Chloroflexota bacterium]